MKQENRVFSCRGHGFLLYWSENLYLWLVYVQQRLWFLSLCESIKMEKTKIFFKKVSGIDEFFRIYIIEDKYRKCRRIVSSDWERKRSTV